MRNFSIVAHVDHGKSTLADRLIQSCGGLSERQMQEQVLDSMDLERERGITIKAQSAALRHTAANGREYLLNLIDTPGHADFSYEVSRSLSACEGALLLIDASQGVEAQSIATCRIALEQRLEIVPVLNKIDLPSADPEGASRQIEEVLGLSVREAPRISAKCGQGIPALLDTLVRRFPPPRGDREAPLRALIVDSWFDNYHGVVSLVRVFDGAVAVGDRVQIFSTGRSYPVQRLGVFTPRDVPRRRLHAGEVGFLIAGIKEIDGAPVGDTLTLARRPASRALPGFRRIKPRVFAGLFPADSSCCDALRTALDKLRLNDSALHFEAEHSQSLGMGFRCGFLGMLHMEIVQERLEREYGLDLITTMPTVIYQALTDRGELLSVDNPARIPERTRIVEWREPVVRADLLAPREYVGRVLALCLKRRGKQQEIRYLEGRTALRFEMPLSEIVLDFFDRLKSVSSGYASFDYDFLGFVPADLVRLDVLLNGKRVDALSSIEHRDSVAVRARQLARRLKEAIPRQMFDVAIQAALGSKIIARETVKGLRKDVTAKCYGGDITRKRKLLERQKAGKRRMKSFGDVQIPQEAFLALLRAERQG